MLFTILFWLVFTFVLGLIIGSFLNVVILRYNTGRSINGRSGCPHCGHKLRYYDLIPLFSWIWLRGKCRYCKTKISVQYPVVELFTGIVFVLVLIKFVSSGGLFYAIVTSSFVPLIFLIANLIIFSILIVIFVYDLRHKIIPDGLVYVFSGIAFLFQILYFVSLVMSNGWNLRVIEILDLLSGPILFTPFALIWYFSKGRAMGFGDAKLALGIGWFLGFVYGLNAIILSFWIGAVFAVCLMLIDQLNKEGRHITMKSEVPFGPFLILAMAIEFFWQYDWINIKMFFE